MERCYEEGRRLFAEAEYPQAHIAFLEALTYAESLQDSDFMGMIYTAEGEVFHQTGNYRDELQAWRAAWECFRLSADEGRRRSAMLNLALACYDNAMQGQADSLCREVCCGQDPADALSLKAMVLQADNAVERPFPDYPSARSLYERVLQTDRNTLSNESFFRYALCLVKTDARQDAERLLVVLDTWTPTADMLRLRAGIALELGEKDRAVQLLTELSKMQDLQTRAREPLLFKAQSEHYRLAAELSDRTSRIYRQRIWLLLTGLLLAASLAAILFLRYRQRQQRQTDRLIAAAEESRRMLEEQSRGAESHRKLFASLYQSQFATIGRLTEPFVSDGRIGEFKAQAGKAYSERLDTILREITNSRSKEFERRLDRDLDGIVSRLRTDFPQFREQDIRFLCYLMAGFETSTIAFLTDMSKGNVRVRKHRLRSTIAESQSPYKAFYLDLIR